MSFNENTTRVGESSNYSPSIADTTPSIADTAQSIIDPRLLPTNPNIPAEFLPKLKERTSWVWKHGSVFQCPDKNGILKQRWKCDLCPNPETAITYADTTTKNAINHLVKFHGFHQNGQLRTDPNNSSNTQNQLLLPPSSSSSINTPQKIIFNSDVFKQLYLRWIITNNISFQQAISPTLRYLLMYLSAVVSNS